MPLQRCTHRFPDTHTCGSPALRGEIHCYYHHPNRHPVSNPHGRNARRGFNLPAPQDHFDLQCALGEVIQRLASNKLDTRRASLLLYSLQLAGRTFN